MIDDRDDVGQPRLPEGLCASCAHAAQVRSARGSVFTLCGLSKVDARFPKYPRLPVVQCAGYRRRETSA